MYDISKRFHKDDLSVAELIEQLKKLPQTAKVCICGDDCCHIHVEQDGSVVNLDTEDLDDCYGEDASIEEGEFNYGGYRFVPYGFLSKRENDDFQYLSGSSGQILTLVSSIVTMCREGRRSAAIATKGFMQQPRTISTIFLSARKMENCIFLESTSCLSIYRITDKSLNPSA